MTLFSLHCNRMASTGGPHIDVELRARIWRCIRPAGRPHGRLLVVRRYDDIFRHDPTPNDAVLLFEFNPYDPLDFVSSKESDRPTLPTGCRMLAERADADYGLTPPCSVSPDGMMEGWVNCGVVDTVSAQGWREQRLLLQGKLNGRRRRHAIFWSPIPNLVEPYPERLAREVADSELQGQEELEEQ
eukprot:SAG22_NODE_25_length_30107_cov_28.456412_12_plen_186_part_00